MTATPSLADTIRAELAAREAPANAAAVQRYMKSTLPCLGVRLPELRRVVGAALRDTTLAPQTRSQWEATVRDLYDAPAYRDHRWAAIEVATHRRVRAWHDPDALRLARHLVVTGAWWDLVDPVSSGLVGSILLSHRAAATPVIRGWMTADDPWLRRTAIICQLQHKDTTDLALLADAITANLDAGDGEAATAYGSEFFIRKAIGWALRQHARVDPDWVRRFVAAHADVLSGLSRREALKHLG